MSKFIKIILCIFLCITFLSGCTGTNLPSDNKVPTNNSFKIVTSFYPMYLFARSITQDIDNVTVTNMSPMQTGCLHDYTLRTGDMKLLENADVFIINGAGIESFLPEVAKQLPKLAIVDASAGIQLLKNNENSETEYNPHIWVSPKGAIKQINNIASKLASINPQNAEKYKINAAALVIKLTELQTKMTAQLKDIKNRNIVTFHEAFSYFASDFNLNVVALIESEPDRQPSPNEIVATISKIKNTNTKAIFTEPQYSEGVANTIAKESGAKIFSLDPIVTGTDSPPLDDYLIKMNKNLDQLKEALK